MKKNIDLSKLTDEERKELIKKFNMHAHENKKKRMYYFDGVHFCKSKF